MGMRVKGLNGTAALGPAGRGSAEEVGIETRAARHALP